MIPAGETAVVPLGIAIEIPPGYEGQLRARSGLAFNYSVGIPHGLGTIDSSFRGELKMLLINHGCESFFLDPGTRVCQLVLNEVIRANLEFVDNLNFSERGEGGFGSTGLT